MEYYTISQAARKIGVSRETLLRWFREGRVEDDIARDINNWRIFTNADIERIKASRFKIISRAGA